MLRQLSVIGLARGLRAVSQAVLLIFLARDTGPAAFGIVAAFFAAHTVLLVVAGMGTPTFATREIALGNSGTAAISLRANSMVLSLAGTVAIASSALVLHNPSLSFAVAANSAGLWSERVSENRMAVAFGQQKVRIPALMLGAQSTIPLVLYFSFSAADVAPLLAFGIARLGGSIASQLLGMARIASPGSGKMSDCVRIVKVQCSFAVNTAMVMIRSLDSIVVISLVGATASGIYSAVSRALTPFTILAVSAAPILVPRATRMVGVAARKSVDLIFLGGVAISAFTLALAPFAEGAVVLIFGPEFRGGGTVLAWALLRSGPEFSIPLIATVLQSRGFDRSVAIISAITAVSTLFAVAVGATVDGAAGAAAGFSSLSLVSLAAIWFIARHRINSVSAVRTISN